VATLVGKAACGRRNDRQNEVRGALCCWETKSVAKSKTTNEENPKEETKKKRKRENENLSTTKILQDVNLRFLVFHESISEKEEKKKEKERVRGFLSQPVHTVL